MRRTSKRRAAVHSKQDRAGLKPTPDRFSAKPEYGYWASMAIWHWHQALILILGWDPYHWLQHNPTFDRYDLTADTVSIPPDLKAKYDKTFAIMETYRRAAWFHDRMPPRDYIEWAKGMRIPVPQELVKELELLGHTIDDWKTRNERLERENSELKERLTSLGATDVPAAEKIRASLEKMALAMAIEKYGYQPGKRSPVPKRICDDVQKQGLTIDEDTVLSRLRDSSLRLPK